MAEETTDNWLSVLRDGKADLLTSWLPVHAPDLVIGPIINSESFVAIAREVLPAPTSSGDPSALRR